MPYTIGSSKFSRDICDLGAIINTVLLLIVDHMVKKHVEISFNVIVRVENFIFLDECVIWDCEVDTEMSIIFGRPFIAAS